MGRAMAEDGPSFDELLRRLRLGDGEAAALLVRRYESAIRREARLRLGPSLRPLADSIDICQSVLATFFVRAAAGQFEIETPGQLLRLLSLIARRKVAAMARRRSAAGSPDLDPADTAPGPGTAVANAELLAEFVGRLSDEERRIWDLRREGLSWDEIADARGGNAAMLRQRYRRAINRASRELGLEEDL